MKVFIARHGEASFDAPSDYERPLTSNGERITQQLVETNLSVLQEVDAIWCSHLLRAQQTAGIYSKALSVTPTKQTFLSPDSQPAKVIRALEAEESCQSILLVSHQPLVGDLVSLFCHGNEFNSHPFITSEVVILEMDYPASGIGYKVGSLLPH